MGFATDFSKMPLGTNGSQVTGRVLALNAQGPGFDLQYPGKRSTGY